jgi:hypothetical protein
MRHYLCGGLFYVGYTGTSEASSLLFAGDWLILFSLSLRHLA